MSLANRGTHHDSKYALSEEKPQANQEKPLRSGRVSEGRHILGNSNPHKLEEHLFKIVVYWP